MVDTVSGRVERPDGGTELPFPGAPLAGPAEPAGGGCGLGTGPEETRRDVSGPGAQVPSLPLLRAARSAIEANLDRPDLSPALIARVLGVSLRTLHRCFSGSGDSVMSFARHRRLHRAHDDLLGSSHARRISEVAARWQFSDASHFIRHFKAAFGSTPTLHIEAHRGKDAAP
ncbi:helix-turn-helix domain-containing protein [Streptomyces sp. NPDC051287]|uniref:helix-turn-helix domain-containing protein n=1 Tax=Streptomyces sp. NPDC051287 TaxID=3365648 RepID=UPI0037B846B6